jgi:hypothetical protein
MTCDEFEAMGWDAQSNASLTDAQRAAVAEHALLCTRCATLRNPWEAARLELRSLAQLTTTAEAPARVEMRLRQQFRTQYRTPKVRRRAAVTAWTLAAAAVLVGAVSWVNWQKSQNGNVADRQETRVLHPGPNGGSQAEPQSLMADSELSDFALLPGVLPTDTDDGAILRVRMQRGALGALGLPVNEDRANEWIQVDLLVGNDGLPEAVRLRE